MIPRRKDSDSLIEEHIGSLLQLMVIGILTWNLTTVVSLRTEVGVLQAQVASLQSTVSQGASDRYRGVDAARDNAAIWAEMERRDARTKRLEEAVFGPDRVRKAK